MNVEVGIALLEIRKTVLMVFGCVIPANLIKLDQRNLFHAIFDERGWNLKNLAKFLAKKFTPK